MHEHRNAERGGGCESRPRLPRIGKEIALRALHEHAAKPELLHRSRQLARRGIAGIGVHRGETVEVSRVPADQLRNGIVDPGDHLGREIAVGIFEEGGRRVDHARGDACLLDGRQQGAGIDQIAIDTLPIRLQRRRSLGERGERKIRTDIVVWKSTIFNATGLSASFSPAACEAAGRAPAAAAVSVPRNSRLPSKVD